MTNNRNKTPAAKWNKKEEVSPPSFFFHSLFPPQPTNHQREAVRTDHFIALEILHSSIETPSIRSLGHQSSVISHQSASTTSALLYDLHLVVGHHS
jgi:hypothetical protein